MSLTPELVALIIYLMDRGFELYELKQMTKEQIKDDMVKQLVTFTGIQDKIKEEMEKYGG